jgi:TP901 family phage tail tape measure protein
MAVGGGNMLNAVLVFGGDASKAINAVNSLNTHLNKLDTAISGLNTKAKTVGRTGTSAFQSWLPIFKSVYTGIRSTVDGFRLMAQGIMSAGRALTFFVSIPLALFFRAGATAIIDFDDQLVKVGKTTGLTGQALENVELALRDIARRAPTAHQELGVMAEQAGQLGISSEKNLPVFVEWMEILATSTNIAGDEVVSTMGKIAASFKWNINESVDDIIRLSNTMNILENTTAATAGEIADALFRFAPIAEQLKIHAADAAALSAMLISAGVSAESTGTRLGTMYVKLTQNADKFAEMAKNTKMYATEQDVLNAINKDAVQVLFDLIQMMGEESNRAEALAAAFDLVNIRGGRALGNLIGSEKQLRDILKRAREEWGEAASLVMEYNRALESAKSHLQILRNNLTEVGVELGNTLLPALNELIELLIPALRRIYKGSF